MSTYHGGDGVSGQDRAGMLLSILHKIYDLHDLLRWQRYHCQKTLRIQRWYIRPMKAK
jgi:hypothetical protein